MTLLDVVFKYGTTPGEKQMMALNNAWEVYGVRKIKFDEKESTVRVEYDASRLNDGEIAGMLRRAGIDLRERVALV
ncbi:MAG TPA: hypothetical protein VEW69_08580 [Alphaproteobacteria bacterium]|nr:hypothetical protein [Alphaproteobacteria bacterium]